MKGSYIKVPLVEGNCKGRSLEVAFSYSRDWFVAK